MIVDQGVHRIGGGLLVAVESAGLNAGEPIGMAQPGGLDFGAPARIAETVGRRCAAGKKGLRGRLLRRSGRRRCVLGQGAIEELSIHGRGQN